MLSSPTVPRLLLRQCQREALDLEGVRGTMDFLLGDWSMDCFKGTSGPETMGKSQPEIPEIMDFYGFFHEFWGVLVDVA